MWSKQIRQQRQWTVRQMSELLGVHRSQVFRWDKGQLPRSDTIRDLADKLGIQSHVLGSMIFSDPPADQPTSPG